MYAAPPKAPIMKLNKIICPDCRQSRKAEPPLPQPEPDLESIELFEPVGLSVPAESFCCIDQHKSEDYSTTEMEDNASNRFGIDTP
jgi:hypothetical protein